MKFISNRVLGIIGMIGAPWMFIDFLQNGLYEHFVPSSISGVRNFVFITGWMCSVLGLYRIQAMGTKGWQKAIGIIQLLLLFFANCWNVIEIIKPTSPLMHNFFLNFAWPAAGTFMLVTGLLIYGVKRLTGWKRVIPFLAGLWFPQTILLYILKAYSVASLVASGIYATIAFMLLGLCLVIDTNLERSKRIVKA